MTNKLSYFFTLLFLVSAGTAYSQAPQKMNYQAVVRDNNGQPLPAGRTIGVRFVIHNTAPNGAVVFTENTTTTTNQFGLINPKIGTNGNLATVDWSSGEKYLQVLVDINGGTNYTDMGTTQLLSVPYALFAANSLAGPPGPAGAIGPTGPAGSGGGTVLPGTGITNSLLVMNGGDIQYKNNALNGVVLKSANQQCWKLSVDNTGNLTTQSVICP